MGEEIDVTQVRLEEYKKSGKAFIGPVLDMVLKRDKHTEYFPIIAEIRQSVFIKSHPTVFAREMPFESRVITYRHFPFVQGMVPREEIMDIAKNPVVLALYLDRRLTNMVFAMERDKKRLNELKITRVKKVTLGETLTVMEVPKLHEMGILGQGVKIAVLDTGANPEHPMIKPNLIHMESVNPNEPDPIAHNPHGPWCLSAAGGAYVNDDEYGPMFGAAPRAMLISIKVLDKDGGGAISTIIKGMDRALELGADIISMSLGAAMSFGDVTPDDRAVDILNSRYAVPAVVAAGNNGLPHSIASPGDARNALTIGSVGFTPPWRFSPSAFSSKGPTSDNRVKPDFTAFGGDIYGNILELIMGASDKGTEYEGEAGTSMATPQMAGVVALVRQLYNKEAVTGVKQVLEDIFRPMAHRPMPMPFKDVLEGWGTPLVGPLAR